MINNVRYGLGTNFRITFTVLIYCQ